MDETSPIPTRTELQAWLAQLAEDVEQGREDPVHLAEALADVRRAARDLGHVADWLLLAAREQGAALPILAASWSASGRRELVNGPTTRLHRLTDRGLTPPALLEAFVELEEHDPIAPWRETP